MMFEGFDRGSVDTDAARIAYVTAGSGPAVLLLHGFPQTHAMWHRVAPALARHFTVVASDLRGYGASSKPEATEAYSFRAMAQDQIDLMTALGHARFHLVGHDRGGRVAHRLALDAPHHLLSLTVMDIVPTHHFFSTLTKRTATDYYHWFFLAQPYPFPETLIASDPDSYFESCLTGWGAARIAEFDAKALAAYRKAWRSADAIRGMCADYRAASQIDFDLDAADLGRKVEAPALVLFGADGAMARAYDIPTTWAPRLAHMRAEAIPGGHFFVDQSPDATTAALLRFLGEL
jgi:haloacetate dehalogenase